MLACISRITTIRTTGGFLGDGKTEYIVANILSDLKGSLVDASNGLERNVEPDGAEIGDTTTLDCYALHSQRISFVYATYIYLYRTVFDTPPQIVQSYISQVFQNVSNFYACSSGNFSIWPAFMAAVESYTNEDMESARKWLTWATSFGVGSRTSVRRIIESVWERRETLSRSSGIPKGVITVDWREVMQELDCDVLLI